MTRSLTAGRRRLTRSAVTGVAAFLTAAALATPASAATAKTATISPGWRTVLSRTYYSPASYDDSNYSAVVAPAKNDAWVLGGSGPGNAGVPEAQHWDGKSWAPVALPAGVTGSIVAASAPAADDIWAVTDKTGYVLHWNGTRWSVALHLKETAGYLSQFTGVTALSPKNVWVFGGVLAGVTDLVGYGTYHFNGTRWTKVPGEGRNIVTASALSPSNIWGLGGYYPSGDGIQHFTGKQWKHARLPAAIGAERGVLAASPQQIWVDGWNNNVLDAIVDTLARWNGKSWQTLPVPGIKDAEYLPAAMTPDGAGGIWMIANELHGSREWMLHRSAAGQWTTELISGGQVDAAVLIPGTRSLWGAGQLWTDPGYALIWSY